MIGRESRRAPPPTREANTSNASNTTFLFYHFNGIVTVVAWEIECTDEFAEWFAGLTENDRADVEAVVDLLQEEGPNLKRPAVGEISRGKVKNLKELRIGTIRVLFAFDPRSVAILLIGGDKAGAWSKWYDEAIAEVEVLYAQYLKELRLEGLIE